jgi:hypothetical protein
VTTRPRRRQPGTPAPRHRDPSPQAPPSVARGLVRAGSPTGPIRAAGCPRLGSPPTGAGTGGIDSTVTAVVMAAVRAATTCCGSTAAATLSRPSLVAVAALPASCGALDERRLVGTAASDLNTLAGVGGHGRRHPANTKTRKSNSHLSRTGRPRERLLTSGWRSPASSSLGARRALCLRLTSPPPHPQTPPRSEPAPPRRAPPLSWTACRRALPHPP